VLSLRLVKFFVRVWSVKVVVVMRVVVLYMLNVMLASFRSLAVMFMFIQFWLVFVLFVAVFCP